MSFARRPFSTSRRRNEAGILRGFGALIGLESTLLWLLNSRSSEGRSAGQREVVAGIILALQQRFELLPVPRRFDFLKKAVQRAESREPQGPGALHPSRGDLIRRHSSLESDLNDLRIRWGADRDWGPTLTHAASAHAQMAYALRIEGRRESS
jgi:hypothetical protein